MDIKKACKKRCIKRISIQTPVLVPSFSSVFSPDIKGIHEWIRDHITAFSLVSAYDLYHGLIDTERIWVSNVVFIDSGEYEYDCLRDVRARKEWSPSLHAELVSRLEPLAKVVLISYDTVAPLTQQISSALNLSSAHPEYAHEFLCKPTLGLIREHDVESLIQSQEELNSFDVLGFTEKELGSSLLERCRRIVMIREHLDSRGLAKPIHILGCLDPLSIVPYFVCGADIFDGLAWLRQAFYNSMAVYVNNYSLISRCWSESDLDVWRRAWLFNLRELDDLTNRMKRFLQEYDLAVFGLKAEFLNEVKALTTSAGIEY